MSDQRKWPDFDPLHGEPPCVKYPGSCLPECEHGYSGPCVRDQHMRRPDLTSTAKVDAWDAIEPELDKMHEVARELGCPAGERVIPWVCNELEKLHKRAVTLEMAQTLDRIMSTPPASQPHKCPEDK